MTMLWLDDVYPAPPGWVWVQSVNAAKRVVESETVTHMSLDHDLGDYAHDGGDGSQLTDWLAEHDLWPTVGLRIHSGNSVGVKVMLATADRYSNLSGWTTNVRGLAPQGGWEPSTP